MFSLPLCNRLFWKLASLHGWLIDLNAFIHLYLFNIYIYIQSINVCIYLYIYIQSLIFIYFILFYWLKLKANVSSEFLCQHPGVPIQLLPTATTWTASFSEDEAQKHLRPFGFNAIFSRFAPHWTEERFVLRDYWELILQRLLVQLCQTLTAVPLSARGSQEVKTL